MRLITILKNLYSAPSPLPFWKRLTRFLRWQFLQKYRTTAFQFALPDGAKMILNKGEHGASGFYYFGYPDYEEISFLKYIIKEGDFFIDVGANSGGWSLSAFGMGASVIAIEPVTSTYQRLSRNFSINNSNKLKAYQLCIGETPGSIRISTSFDTSNRIVGDDYLESYEIVEVNRLDSVLQNSNPAVIKIDVEGYELNVLKGANDTLSKPSLKALIIETFRWANYAQANLQEIESLLHAYKFLPVQFDPSSNKARRLAGKEGSQNTIYLRQDLLSV